MPGIARRRLPHGERTEIHWRIHVSSHSTANPSNSLHSRLLLYWRRLDSSESLLFSTRACVPAEAVRS